MNKDLYFLQIITEALKAPNPRAEIKKAFEKIAELGRQPDYRQGYLQFCQFMDKVKESSDTDFAGSEGLGQEMIRELVFQIATGLFDRDSSEGQRLLELIRSKPEWRKEFERLSAQVAKSEPLPGQMEIVVVKNGDVIESFPLKPPPFIKSVRDVTPGSYEVKLSSGRVIWEGDLNVNDLLWAAAFPEQKLDMAADTDDTFKRPTRELRLLDGELTIRVFPEIESGRIEFEIKEAGFDK
jgi:hypothetical protein